MTAAQLLDYGYDISVIYFYSFQTIIWANFFHISRQISFSIRFCISIEYPAVSWTNYVPDNSFSNYICNKIILTIPYFEYKYRTN